MGKRIITVTRQFGSLGRPIAKKIAEHMNMKYYDRDVIEKSALELGIPVVKFEEFGDRKLSVFDKMMYPLGVGNGVLQANVFEAERKIISGMAEEGNCVIVGRCSDYILREGKVAPEDMLNLFFFAPYENRMHNCMNSLGLDHTQAEEYLTRVDEARERFYRQHTNADFSAIDYRNLMIDTSVMEMEELVNWLCILIEKKFS